MAGEHAGAKAVLPVLLEHIYRKFAVVWLGPESRNSTPLPRVARCGRGWFAAHGASYPGGHVSSGRARPSFCPVRYYSHPCADDRADLGRMDHLQLFLAVDFFH